MAQQQASIHVPLSAVARYKATTQMHMLRRLVNHHNAYLSPIFQRRVRTLTTSPINLANKPLPPRPKIDDSTITESFLKGSGPGGQKINKTSSAVQIKHLPTGIVVKSQETRSREQNRKLARQILAEKLDGIENGDESRMAIKAERVRKKKASASKKTRRKYRKLGEEKGEEETVDGKEEVEAAQKSGDVLTAQKAPLGHVDRSKD